MNVLYRAIWRHLAILSILATVVAIAGGVLWLVAEVLGVHFPLPWAIFGAGAIMLWSIWNDRGRPSSPPDPQPLPAPTTRSLSRTDVEVLLLLQREGLISAAELRAALDGLIPSLPADKPDARSRGH